MGIRNPIFYRRTICRGRTLSIAARSTALPPLPPIRNWSEKRATTEAESFAAIGANDAFHFANDVAQSAAGPAVGRRVAVAALEQDFVLDVGAGFDENHLAFFLQVT